MRTKLEKTRKGRTHKFSITWMDESTKELRCSEYYLITGEYPDGRVGEIFVKTAQKDDSLLDQWCRSLSINLQCGLPTRKLVDLFGYTKFDPAGMTDNKELPTCSSLVDYIVRWMDRQYGHLCREEA